MFKLLIRGIRSHIVRFLLTGLSIILGITFLVGSFVITDTIRVSFDDLFTQLTKGTDAVVQGPLERGGLSDPDEQERRRPVSAALVPLIQRLPGVAFAEGAIQTTSQSAIAITDSKNRVIGGKTSPQLGYSWTEHQAFTPWRLTRGRAPKLDSEIVIDAGSAREGKLS